MKNKLKLFLLVVLCLSLTGCQEKYKHLDENKYTETIDLLKNKTFENEDLKIEVVKEPKIRNQLKEEVGSIRNMIARLVVAPIKIKITNKTDKVLYLPSISYHIQYNGTYAKYEEIYDYDEYLFHVKLLAGWKLKLKGSSISGGSMFLTFPDSNLVDQNNDDDRPKNYKASFKIEPHESVESIDLSLMKSIEGEDALVIVDDTHSLYIEDLQTDDSKISESCLKFYFK